MERGRGEFSFFFFFLGLMPDIGARAEGYRRTEVGNKLGWAQLSYC